MGRSKVRMRAVNGAASLRPGLFKWKAILECGHVLVMDMKLNPPVKTAQVRCRKCEDDERLVHG